jgi:tetratricopeptide (TPR) repeat protein
MVAELYEIIGEDLLAWSAYELLGELVEKPELKARCTRALAALSGRLHDVETARRRFAQAVTMIAQNAPDQLAVVRVEYGDFEFGQGETVRALEHYRRALDAWPAAVALRHDGGTFVRVRLRVAELLYSAGELEDAARHAAHAIKSCAHGSAGWGEGHLILAHCLAGLGIVDVARRSYQEVLQSRDLSDDWREAARSGLRGLPDSAG